MLEGIVEVVTRTTGAAPDAVNVTILDLPRHQIASKGVPLA